MNSIYPILDHYSHDKPTRQALVDIFKGEWSSSLPSIKNEQIISGQAGLFDDPRIHSLNNKVSLSGKKILELGPLEAGHTYMMHEMGAEKITAIEANNRAMLKCLIVKEIYELNRAQFLFGDVINYLKDCTEKFDVCVASGILYHMTEPAMFLELCSRVSDKLFIWSHYADAEIIKTHPVLSEKIKSTEEQVYRDMKYTEYQYEYAAALGWAGFCGGADSNCRWLTKETILEILKMNGFKNIHVFFDDLSNNPNGPQICLLAEK